MISPTRLIIKIVKFDIHTFVRKMASAAVILDDETLREIGICYRNSMSLVSQAVTEDERRNVELAIEYYQCALEILERGISLTLYRSENRTGNWENAQYQQSKMTQALENVKQRLDVLRSQAHTSSHVNPQVPSYSAALPEGHTSLSTNSGGNNNNHFVIPESAAELLVIPNGVQMYFVSSDSQVATTPPSYPTSLRVVVIDSDSVGDKSIVACLQIGDWVYPLRTGQTPALKTENGTYIFPNYNAEGLVFGSAIGIVISPEIDAVYVETFEHILLNLASFKCSQHTHPLEEKTQKYQGAIDDSSVSGKIAYGLEKGAEWLSLGLGKGAELTSDLVQKGSEQIKKNLTPNENPTKVDDTVQKGLYYTHEASKVTIKASQALVNGVKVVTSKIGEQLGPHLKDLSNKILPDSLTAKTENEESNLDGAVKVAGAGLVAFSTVWNELEKSGLVIAKAISSATVENVQFKYGAEAGKVTSLGMSTAVNVGKTAFNLDNIGMKAIARRSAMDTGKAVLKEYSSEAKYETNSKHQEFEKGGK